MLPWRSYRSPNARSSPVAIRATSARSGAGECEWSSAIRTRGWNCAPAARPRTCPRLPRSAMRPPLAVYDGRSVPDCLVGRTQHAIPANPEGVGRDAQVDDQRLAHDVRPRQEAPKPAVVRLVAVVAHHEIMPRRHDHGDRKSTRLNSSHVEISYAVFCLKKKRI